MDSLAVSLINDVINQCKLDIADSKIDETCQTDIITDVDTQTKDYEVSKHKKRADYMQYRQRLRDAYQEGFMRRQLEQDRAYRQKQKKKV